MSTRASPSINLKAYQCPDGREIHYSIAILRREATSTSILDIDNPTDEHLLSSSITKIGACWVYFTPMGPNRRILELVVNHYAEKFECDKDVMFLCVNRPGKCGTSSSTSTKQYDDKTANVMSDEMQHVQTSCDDIITILDHYGTQQTSLFYMCAGSTFAYSFASKYPERCSGYIIGIASWVLHSDSSSAGDIQTPTKMNALSHRLAMKGIFGPKWLVGKLVGSVAGSVSPIFSTLPTDWVVHLITKDLSKQENQMFDEKYPDDGAKFVDLMNWVHNDGCDDEVSVFVNQTQDVCEESGCFGSGSATVNGSNKHEGDAKDTAVCLSAQQDLGLIYKHSIPTQKQVLLWHGEDDKMISIEGAEYLEGQITNATLTRIPSGTHQGVMFFFPDAVIDALNRISRDVLV